MHKQKYDWYNKNSLVVWTKMFLNIKKYLEYMKLFSIVIKFGLTYQTWNLLTWLFV
jgi:hypothetical protein